MKTSFQKFSFVFFFVVTGCVTLYEPNTIHSPLLNEKGELTTSFVLGSSGSGLYNVQSAYAISDHTAMMINVMDHYKHRADADTSVENLYILFGEAGGGYFTSFGKNNSWLFQCYGGGGYGITRYKVNNDIPPDPQVNAEYYNVFLQPGFANRTEFLEIAFDLRINYVRFFYIHAYEYPLIAWWDPDLNYFSDTQLDFMILEPAITGKVGKDRLHGLVQLGFAMPVFHPDAYMDVKPSTFFLSPNFKLSFGIRYTFGTKRN